MTLKYVLVEMDETDGVEWRLYRRSDGSIIAEFDSNPSPGQIARAKADNVIPADSNRPNRGKFLDSISDAFDDQNHYQLLESQDAFPPWE